MDWNLPVESTYNAQNYFGGEAKVKRKDMDMQAFIELLAVQLSNQNPLEPMNDRDFFAQMAQLGTVQGMDKLEKSMAISQASGLMGKTVTAYRAMTETVNGVNELITGKVEKLTVRNGDYILSVRTADNGLVDVKMSGIREVQN